MILMSHLVFFYAGSRYSYNFHIFYIFTTVDLILIYIILIYITITMRYNKHIQENLLNNQTY